MPEIPITGFVVEACGAIALALILLVFERQHPRAGVRDWSFGLWALAVGLIGSIATVHPPRPDVHVVLRALADTAYYWSRVLLLLGTWARWRDEDAGRLRWPLLTAFAVVSIVTNLRPLSPWRPVVLAGTYTLVMAPAALVAGVLLLRGRRDGRRLGANLLAVAFLGQALEDLFLTAAAVATFLGARPPLTAAAGGRLIEVELLLLMFTGVGMVAWLLEDEREGALDLEQTLRRKEAMSVMGALVAGVAHEVRNPLFGISSTLDALEVHLGADAASAPYLSTLRGEARRLSRLMSQLLDYGRPVTPGLTPEPLGPALEEAMRSCDALAAGAGVRVEASGDVPALTVSMDRPRLVQVFQNLIQNSIQHSPGQQRVLVAVEAEPWHGRRGLRCTIRDFGPGFDPDDVGHLFEPFFTRRREGTGLGLSIVQRIVQEHSGHVEAANHAEGGGVVSVWLPAAGAPPHVTERRRG
jgi:signal transduction histidine kinase